MKTIFIAHSWTDVSLNIQTKKVAEKLSEQYRVVFFTQARIGKKEVQINERLTVKEWPHKRPSKIADVLFFIKNVLVYKPETIVVHFGATNVTMFIAALLGVKNRVCWMHTLSGQIFLDVKNETEANAILNRRIKAYKRSTNIVVQNSAGYTDALTNYGIPEKKLKLIYNGLEDPLKQDYTKQSNLEFAYVGRIDFSKGVDILIRAFAVVLKQYPQAKLKIAGKGAEENSMKDLCAALGIANAVNFAGWLSDYNDIYSFIKDAYCLVVPSRLDNFPTVVLEALACKTPVIAANVGGIPDMIKNEEGGYLFENENVNELADKMMNMVADQQFWQNQCMLARQRFLQNFSMQKHVTEVEHYISSLNK